jgi:hypothetical protein
MSNTSLSSHHLKWKQCRDYWWRHCNRMGISNVHNLGRTSKTSFTSHHVKWRQCRECWCGRERCQCSSAMRSYFHCAVGTHGTHPHSYDVWISCQQSNQRCPYPHVLHKSMDSLCCVRASSGLSRYPLHEWDRQHVYSPNQADHAMCPRQCPCENVPQLADQSLAPLRPLFRGYNRV